MNIASLMSTSEEQGYVVTALEMANAFGEAWLAWGGRKYGNVNIALDNQIDSHWGDHDSIFTHVAKELSLPDSGGLPIQLPVEDDRAADFTKFLLARDFHNIRFTNAYTPATEINTITGEVLKWMFAYGRNKYARRHDESVARKVARHFGGNATVTARSDINKLSGEVRWAISRTPIRITIDAARIDPYVPVTFEVGDSLIFLKMVTKWNGKLVCSFDYVPTYDIRTKLDDAEVIR